MTKSDALTTVEDAAEVLHLDEDEMDAAIEDGTLRRVTHGEDTFVLGADVDRLQRESDPTYLAKLVSGLVQAEDEDGDTPQTLAAKVQRF